jgi:hypothetical protein
MGGDGTPHLPFPLVVLADRCANRGHSAVQAAAISMK